MEEINDSNFDEMVVKGEDFSLVIFSASRCNSCHQLINFLESVEKDYQASFFKYNIDDNFMIANNYGIMSLPTVLVFKCGAPAGQVSGFSGIKKMEEFINECFCKN